MRGCLYFPVSRLAPSPVTDAASNLPGLLTRSPDLNQYTPDCVGHENYPMQDDPEPERRRPAGVPPRAWQQEAEWHAHTSSDVFSPKLCMLRAERCVGSGQRPVPTLRAGQSDVDRIHEDAGR